MFERWRQRSFAEVLLDSAGFFIGVTLILFDYLLFRASLTTENIAFIRSPQSWVWLLLVAGQFALWFYVAFPMWRCMKQIKDDYHLGFSRELSWKSFLAVVYFLIPGMFSLLVVPKANLAHHDLKLGIVNLVGALVAIVPLVGIWYVRSALEVSFGEGIDLGGDDKAIKQRLAALLRLRGDLQRFITFLGVMIALATLAKGALRQAYISTGGTPSAFPPEYVLLHGAYFTGLLALVYIPTYDILAGIGFNLVDYLFPLQSDELDPRRLSDWQSNRQSLVQLLQLQTGAVENLKASVSILGPLASSVIAVLLGTNK